MDDWPPTDYDYHSKLKENGLRQVEFQKWKAEPEKDVSGSKKNHFLSFFNGLALK